MNEYISRKELIKAFETDYTDYNRSWCSKAEGYDEGVRDEYDDVLKIICAMAAADVQPVKHGRWIAWDDSGFTKCSCCNSEYYIADLQTVGDSEGFVNFCPNCGTRMDLGDEKT